MFQAATTQPVEVVDNAIQFGAIAYTALVMSGAAIAVILVYILKTLKTQISAADWIHANLYRFIAAGGLIIVIASLVVASPEVSALFGAIGFNASQSPIALGMFVATLLIGSTTEPSTAPEG